MIALLACALLRAQDAPSAPPENGPLHRTVELARGESAEVELWNGRKTRVKLLDLGERRDPWARVEIDGEEITLAAGDDRLPTSAGGVQIDCPVTRAGAVDAWGLLKDARVRIWPAGSPWARPGRFGYPARQRWAAGSAPRSGAAGLEVSGCEGLVDVLAIADGVIIGARGELQPEHQDAAPLGADQVLILDTQGWRHRAANFEIHPSVKVGKKVYRGQKLGTLGKTDVRVETRRREADGRWILEDMYAFAWEAYRREFRQDLLAIARPLVSGDTATLDGGRSWSASKIVRYAWTFSDGTTAEGPRVERAYPKPGCYTETLTVTDTVGRVSTDVVVVVADREKAAPAPIHASYAPTFGLQPGDPVTFKIRGFRGDESWDFGDGTPAIRSSDSAAVTTHAFAKPGVYQVRIHSVDARGAPSTARLRVSVGEAPRPTKPFRRKVHVIPGRIEAEDYDEGDAGVAYEDVDVKNNGADYRGPVGVDIEPRAEASGGFNLGWTRPGEWTAYTVDVREAGVYDVNIPVACLQKGGTFHLEFNGKNVSGPIQVPDTGAWEVMKPFRHEGVRLSAGAYVMKVRLDTPGERGSIGDLDFFEFVRRP